MTDASRFVLSPSSRPFHLARRLRPRRRLLPAAFVAGAGLCLSLGLSGCEGGENGENGTDGEEGKNATPSFQDVEAVVSPKINTVVHVTWKSDEPTRGYVEFGPKKDDLSMRTPLEAEATKEHDQLLLGLRADTEYFYRVVLADGENMEDVSASEIKSVATEGLPVGLPQITISGPDDRKGHDKFTLVPVISGEDSAMMVIDPEGYIVWYHPVDDGLDTYRGVLSLDGKSILYNAGSVSGDIEENSEIVRVGLDGEVIKRYDVPLLAHDIVEHPDGTIGAIVVEYRKVGGEKVRGDTIVEVSPDDGKLKTVFSTFDCFDPEKDQGTKENGWTFANALDYDPDEEVYYLGMRNFSSITKVDRDSGKCEWTFGSTANDFEFVGDSADELRPFKHQHQFEVHSDRILVFDNDGALGNNSQVSEYELDFDEMTATRKWSYQADPSVYTFVLGEPTTLDNGDLFVNWSAAGQMDRIDEDHELLWRIQIPAGQILGFSTVIDSLYQNYPTGE